MATLKAGVILINPTTHKIGLVYREKRNDYSFPKGHLEKGETLQECAVRETAEETKRACRLLSEKEIYLLKYTTPTGEECENYMYVAEDIGPSDNTSWDTHDLHWVEWNEVEKKLSYQNLKDMWHQVKEEIKGYLTF